MKISYMLRRENFYEINHNTLKKYYMGSRTPKQLYIYPELNAIVTRFPDRTVKNYLYTEFKVSGSALRRFLASVYTRVMLNSGGLLASRVISLPTDADEKTLIYPCNKKYRIFDFSANTVSVLAKDGFPAVGLAREIKFRTQASADFIPGLLHHDENGYVERIIDGYPVARAGERTRELCERAYAIWNAYVEPQITACPGLQYAKKLEQVLNDLTQQAQAMGKAMDLASLHRVCAGLLHTVAGGETIPVALSHGDLQPGNIWVENGTDRLYIIDWESVGRRSVWYDQATLYEQIRRDDGLAAYSRCRDLIHSTVLMEDVLFRLEELVSLPDDYGSVQFGEYIKGLQEGKVDV